MTTMAEERRPARRDPATPPPRVRRTAEQWLLGLGMAVSFVTMGGFVLVMNRIEDADFEQAVMPTLVGADAAMPASEARMLADTLASWFGVTLIAVLLLSVIALFLTRRRPPPRGAGGWALAARLACLLGSQLILFPVAFVFFVTAGLFALRPVTDGSPS